METPAILRRNVADITPAVTDMGRLNRAARYASLVKRWLAAHRFKIAKGHDHNHVEAHDSVMRVQFTYRENSVRAQMNFTIQDRLSRPVTFEAFERYLEGKYYE